MPVYLDGSNWSDRLPQKVPGAVDNARYYQIIDSDGEIIHNAVKLVLVNEVLSDNVGTPVNAGNLNAILAAANTTTGTADHLELVQKGFMLFDGACVRFRLHTMPIPGSDGKTYLNINATGDKAVMSIKGRPLKGLTAGNWVTAIYSEPLDFFVLQGEGGDTERFGNGINQISTYELMLVGHFNPYYGR